METVSINIPRAEARDLYRQYRKHQHYSTPIDNEIRRAYQLLAQGRLIIRALASIAAAGTDDLGRPKLAIARADAKECRWKPRWNGTGGTLVANDLRGPFRNRLPHSFDQSFDITMPTKDRDDSIAIVPLIPIHLRPKRALANYHILWEAEWQKTPPVDPYLLRRIGKSDMWLVVAMWDLTPVERAALAARIPAS